MTVVGDTVINDHPCSILAFPYTEAYPSGPSMQDTTLVFMNLKNDSLLFRTAEDSSFKLLMDFNASPGSSWTIPLMAIWSGEELHDTITYTVLATDTLWYDGQPLKRVHYHAHASGMLYFTEYVGQFVERIGDLTYLFPWGVQWVSDGASITRLLCYSDPSFSWPAPNVPCQIWLNSPDQLAETFLIRPTVNTTGLTFYLETEVPQGLIQVHDASGRKSLELRISSTQSSFHLERSGLYIVTYTLPSGQRRAQRILVE